jgi:hypothetical protein
LREMETKKLETEGLFWPSVLTLLLFFIIIWWIPVEEPWRTICFSVLYPPVLLLPAVWGLITERGKRRIRTVATALLLLALALVRSLPTIVNYQIVFADSMYEEWFPDYCSQSYDRIAIEYGTEAAELLRAVKPGDRLCLEGGIETICFGVRFKERRSVLLEFSAPCLFDVNGQEIARIIAGYKTE